MKAFLYTHPYNNVFRITQFLESSVGEVSNSITTGSSEPKHSSVICTIDEVNPGMKRLIKIPSHVRFGDTRFSDTSHETGK